GEPQGLHPALYSTFRECGAESLQGRNGLLDTVRGVPVVLCIVVRTQNDRAAMQHGGKLEEILQLRLVLVLHGPYIELLQGINAEDPDAVPLCKLRGLCGRHSVDHGAPRQVIADLHLRKAELSSELEKILQAERRAGNPVQCEARFFDHTLTPPMSWNHTPARRFEPARHREYLSQRKARRIDMITTVEPKTLRYWVGGEWRNSRTDRFMDCYDPSIGEVVARTPQCTPSEVESAIAAAKAAFPAWADTPPNKRVQVLFRMKALLDRHQEELTRLVAEEHGKVWDEAMGDVLKVTEVVEFAAGAPHLLKGPAVMNATPGYDTTQYLEPVGVFAGIAPWNFPAMIPMGWMAPLCIATGNTMVIKAASFVPRTSMRIMELWAEAGLPRGVLNLVTCSRAEAEILLTHPDVKGISFVGSTSVGKHIYATAAAHGKRVQALTEAKNH